MLRPILRGSASPSGSRIRQPQVVVRHQVRQQQPQLRCSEEATGARVLAVPKVQRVGRRAGEQVTTFATTATTTTTSTAAAAAAAGSPRLRRCRLSLATQPMKAEAVKVVIDALAFPAAPARHVMRHDAVRHADKRAARNRDAVMQRHVAASAAQEADCHEAVVTLRLLEEAVKLAEAHEAFARCNGGRGARHRAWLWGRGSGAAGFGMVSSGGGGGQLLAQWVTVRWARGQVEQRVAQRQVRRVHGGEGRAQPHARLGVDIAGAADE